ncbi:MAG: arginase [Firmicutes bacterium]|nr:arginase [Bacillota bacterium]
MEISVIGVPIDLGANRRGVDMGPSALRYAGLQAALEGLGRRVEDMGNLAVPNPEHSPAGDPNARHLPTIVAVLRDVATRVAETLRGGRLPLVLGGDHSLSVGTVGGVRAVHPDVGVIWLDAHGDFNTPGTSPSGNVHGMALAALAGYGPSELAALAGPEPVRPQRLALIGVRDLDPGERRLIKESGILVFTIEDVDRLGLTAVMERAVEHMRRHARGVHISLDMDVFEPELAPGVGTPKAGGLTYREGHLAMEMLAEAGFVVSMDIVEVNPILDTANRTARLAVDMARSALGARIL